MAKKSDIEKFKREQKYKTREVNRCFICGRARGYLRRFGLCRLCFKERAHQGLLPGVTKASW